MAQKPTETIRDGVNELTGYNDRTAGKEAGNMYMGKDVLIVELRERREFEGEWSDGDERYDLVDSIDEYRRQDIGTQQGKRQSGNW